MRSRVWIVGLAAAGLAGAWRLKRRQVRPQPPPPRRPVSVLPVIPSPGPAPARSRLDSAEFRSARAEVERTVAARPRDVSLRMRSAKFYLSLGDNRSALTHLRAATRLAPSDTIAWIALGDTATICDQPSTAAEAYDRAARLEPDNPFIVRGRGQLLVRQHRLGDARTVLEAGLKRHNDDLEIRTALGNLYLITGLPGRAITTLEPAVHEMPGRGDLHYMLGEAHARNLHLERAVDEMRQAVTLDPTLDRAWGQMGLYLVTLTRYREAREPLQRAIALRPQESHLYWALGESYLMDTMDSDPVGHAVELDRKAVDLDPGNDKALYSLATALIRRGRPDDLKASVPLLERSARLQPADPKMEYKLAEVLRRLGRASEAADHLSRFQARYRKSASSTVTKAQRSAFEDTADVHLRLGDEHLRRREYGLAIQEFQLVLDREPSLPAARQRLAEAKKRAEVRP